MRSRGRGSRPASPGTTRGGGPGLAGRSHGLHARVALPECRQEQAIGRQRLDHDLDSAIDLMLNAIEYLIDPNGVIEARAKEVKLRLLDTVKARKEQTQWRLINIAVPLLFLGLFGWFFNWRRKRRYAR